MQKRAISERVNTLEEHLRRRLSQLETFRTDLQPEEMCFIRKISLELMDEFKKNIDATVHEETTSIRQPTVPYITFIEEKNAVSFNVKLQMNKIGDESNISIISDSYFVPYELFTKIIHEIRQETQKGLNDKSLHLSPDLLVAQKIKHRLKKQSITA